MKQLHYYLPRPSGTEHAEFPVEICSNQKQCFEFHGGHELPARRGSGVHSRDTLKRIKHYESKMDRLYLEP